MVSFGALPSFVAPLRIAFVVVGAASTLLAACAPSSPFEGSAGGPSGTPKDKGNGICLLHNCQNDDECGSCDGGRNTCLADEGRCVACDAKTNTGCPSGQSCSSWGNCVPTGLDCPTDGHGLPTIGCSSSADCAACDPMHQVCDSATSQCVACTSIDSSACQSTDLCLNDACSAKCPQACTKDDQCAACGTGASPAHACNAHQCAECSPTYACPSGKECSPEGVCRERCGVDSAGSCNSDADCTACEAGNTTCHKPINGGAGQCGATAAGCSDLGQGALALPAPFDQVTNTCSGDADCAGVGVEFNVGKLLRDLTGFDQIHDANIVYPMGTCAGVQISDKTSCGICVPCKVDTDCQDLDIDSVAGDAFGGLGSIAAAYLLDQIFGPNDHKVYMYCDTVAGDYGVCAPCPGLLNDCKVGDTGTGSGPGTTGSSGSGGGTCDHDVCSSGSALDGSCDACAGTVCGYDSYCCSNAWDSTCIGEAQSYCNRDCSGSGSASGSGSGSSSSTGGGTNCHDQCSQGAALDATCNSCVEAVCAQDSYCCNTAWDSECIDHVNSLCTPTCY